MKHCEKTALQFGLRISQGFPISKEQKKLISLFIQIDEIIKTVKQRRALLKGRQGKFI